MCQNERNETTLGDFILLFYCKRCLSSERKKALKSRLENKARGNNSCIRPTRIQYTVGKEDLGKGFGLEHRGYHFS